MLAALISNPITGAELSIAEKKDVVRTHGGTAPAFDPG